MGELLRAIDAYTGHAITRLAMQVSPHVMARPGELRMAEWSEFDLDNAVWKIPAERMKMRRPHEVPLSRQVLAYLEELFALTGPDGRSEEHTSELQSLMRISYAVFCLQKKNKNKIHIPQTTQERI